MSSPASLAVALEAVRQSFAAGRMAHAYIIAGAPRGNALELAEAMLKLVLCEAPQNPPCNRCDGCRRVARHAHPDIFWMEPESKSRQILVGEDDSEGIRQMIRFINLTPLTGAWKAGVLLYADCMNDAARNAFLKTLEEPPAGSLILLLTDAPQALGPTIISRCQRIALPTDRDVAGEAWYPALHEWLRAGLSVGGLEALVRADMLMTILEDVKARAEEEVRAMLPAWEDEQELDNEVFDARVKARVLETREAILKQALQWQRDVLWLCLGLPAAELHFKEDIEVLRRQAAALDYAGALANIRRIENMARQLSRNMSDKNVIAAALV